MSRKKWTENKIAELHQGGHGQGTGANYKPWIEITDLSSLGRSRRVKSHKTGRTHHLLSDVEYDIFLAAEWSRSVVDIREQFPLDREITQTIAQDLKIRHPHYPGTRIPTVMTVDFLLTIHNGEGENLVALNAKRDDEAEKQKSIEKLEIQRSYFAALHIPHHLIYYSCIPKQKIKNLAWIRDAQLKPEEKEPYNGFFDNLKTRMGDELAGYGKANISLVAYCTAFDERHGTHPGTGLRVARMLMQERALHTDLEAIDLTQLPLNDFLMTSRSGQLRMVRGK